MICPATMLAKRRDHRCRLIMSNHLPVPPGSDYFHQERTPGGQKICSRNDHWCLPGSRWREMYSSPLWKAVLPVTFAEPGINRNKLLMRIKKKTLTGKAGISAIFFPGSAWPTSSLTKVITGSLRSAILWGRSYTQSFFFLAIPVRAIPGWLAPVSSELRSGEGKITTLEPSVAVIFTFMQFVSIVFFLAFRARNGWMRTLKIMVGEYRITGSGMVEGFRLWKSGNSRLFLWWWSMMRSGRLELLCFMVFLYGSCPHEVCPGQKAPERM